MAEEYILLKDSNENGKIALNKSVFKSIVEISLNDTEEVIKLKENQIAIKINRNKLEVNAGVVLKTGVNVKAVCENLQKSIYDNIFMMTNIKCNNIAIDVLGFKA